jgi:hypothetical protein
MDRHSSSIITTGTGHIAHCRSRHRSPGGRLQRCRHPVTLVFCVVIVSAVSFTSTSWRRDEIFAPYRRNFTSSQAIRAR